MSEENPISYNYDFLQKDFRAQAEKKIALTLKRLDKSNLHGFYHIQNRAHEKTMSYLNIKATNLTKKEKEDLYNIYFPVFLKREAKKSILSEVNRKRFGKELIKDHLWKWKTDD